MTDTKTELTKKLDAITNGVPKVIWYRNPDFMVYAISTQYSMGWFKKLTLKFTEVHNGHRKEYKLWTVTVSRFFKSYDISIADLDSGLLVSKFVKQIRIIEDRIEEEQRLAAEKHKVKADKFITRLLGLRK